ncbi:MAG: MerR family transcriptional regulator [Ignavibacteria bacterium]|nr:MerR family transcriptional regulator [Ignavibacteria bacterium]
MKNFSMKKLYYSISEVSRICDLEQYVLRYWETEFEQLKPAKNSSGNRIYTNKDIKMILLIKKLLKEEKYTIEGAKKIIKNYNVSDDGVEKSNMDVVEVQKQKAGELSLFDSQQNETAVMEEGGEREPDKMVEDLKELRKFLEELYNQLED